MEYSLPRGSAIISNTCVNPGAACARIRRQPTQLVCGGAAMDVRSASYLTDGIKVKSEAPMFVAHSVVRIDSLSQRCRIADVMELGRVKAQRSESAPFPSILVLNLMIPMETATMLRHPSCVRTANVVSIHTLDPATLVLQRKGRPTAAMNAFREWYAASLSEATPTLTALKFVPILLNVDEALCGSSIPSAVARTLRKMNAKPVLARNTVSVSHSTVAAVGDGAPLRVLELDVDMQQWSYVRRKALDATRALSPNMELAIGWLLEARTEATLPEQIFARLEMKRISIELDTFRASPAARGVEADACVGSAAKGSGVRSAAAPAPAPEASAPGGAHAAAPRLDGASTGARFETKPTAAAAPAPAPEASAPGGAHAAAPRLDGASAGARFETKPTAAARPLQPARPARDRGEQYRAHVAPLESGERSSSSDDVDDGPPTALAKEGGLAVSRLSRAVSRRSSSDADAIVVCCGGTGAAAMCSLS